MNTEIVLALEKAFPTLEPEDAEIDPNEWREKAAAEIIDEIEQLVRRLKELRSGQASTFRYYR